MATFTKTSIACDALLALGQEPISNLDDTSDPNAIRIKSIFDYNVHRLQARDWLFNRARVQLAQLVTGPAFGTWKYRYTIPAGSINIRGLCDLYSDEILYPYQREGQYIFSNVEDAYLLYNELLSDVSLWPGWFCNLLSAVIGYRMAPKLIPNDSWIMKRMKEERDESWIDAMSGNGQDSYFEDAHGDSNGNDDVTYGGRERYDAFNL